MIPDYQSLMLPLLRLAEDGREHRVRDVIEPLANQLGLSQAELHEMLRGGQPIFNNRVNWAKTYLTQAKLVEITRRAHFRITERGRGVLRENPVRVDVKLLERFPEFKEFKQRARASQAGDLFPPAVEPSSKADAVENLATPDELLRATITSIEAALSSELLDRVLGAPPIFFEELLSLCYCVWATAVQERKQGGRSARAAMVGSMGSLTKIPWGSIECTCRPNDTS